MTLFYGGYGACQNGIKRIFNIIWYQKIDDIKNNK